jgi:hypothetical protein
MRVPLSNLSSIDAGRFMIVILRGKELILILQAANI